MFFGDCERWNKLEQFETRLFGPYDTFEDYCKDVEGLAYSTAREKIQAYLVHKAIEENLGTGIPAPKIESQVTQFYRHDGAIAKFKTEKRVVTCGSRLLSLLLLGARV